MEDIDWDQMMEWMVAANVEKHRCIYENDDIIVEHQIISYESVDREALMLAHQLRWINVANRMWSNPVTYKRLTPSTSLTICLSVANCIPTSLTCE